MHGDLFEIQMQVELRQGSPLMPESTDGEVGILFSSQARSPWVQVLKTFPYFQISHAVHAK